MSGSNKSYILEYWDLIKRKEVVVGYWIRKQMQQLVRDLEDPRFIFDPHGAHKRIDFEQKYCYQSKAPYYMKPLVLTPWQCAWWEAIYGFKMAVTGLRRFTYGLLEIARKNGKSTMIAADANYDLFVGDPGSDICCASNDDGQAKLIWNEVRMMREHLDPNRIITGQTLVELRNRKRNVSVTRLSSKMKNLDGRNYSKTHLDESHDIDEENGQSRIAEACWRGMSSRDNPLFINCSTQGFNRNCYLDKQIAYAKSVLRGETEDLNLLAFLFEQDSEQEIWQDESSWEKSNPSIRYGIKKVDKLRRDVEIAKHDKATRIFLLTKDFNLPQSSAQGWLLLDDYDYAVPAFDLDEFRGSFCLGAVDLSATTDLSNAKVLLMKPGGKTKYVFTHYWIPESKLENSDDIEAGARYAEWARAGLLTIHEGNEIDISAIADWFFKLYKAHDIKPYKIGYDQRYSKNFTDRCEQYNFDCEMIAQGRFLSNAMKLVEADLKSRSINYGRNEIDLWCLGNCCCAVDGVGSIQPIKIPGQNSRRIDGAVTLIILYETYRRYRADFRALVGGDLNELS